MGSLLHCYMKVHLTHGIQRISHNDKHEMSMFQGSLRLECRNGTLMFVRRRALHDWAVLTHRLHYKTCIVHLSEAVPYHYILKEAARECT